MNSLYWTTDIAYLLWTNPLYRAYLTECILLCIHLKSIHSVLTILTSTCSLVSSYYFLISLLQLQFYLLCTILRSCCYCLMMPFSSTHHWFSVLFTKQTLLAAVHHSLQLYGKLNYFLCSLSFIANVGYSPHSIQCHIFITPHCVGMCMSTPNLCLYF